MTNLSPPPLPVGRWDPDEPQETAAVAVAEAPQPAPNLPVARQQGGQVALYTQVVAAVRHGYQTARLRAKAMAARDGNVVAGLIAAQPESVEQHQRYLHSRGWIPPGHETGGVVERAGVLYHVLIGTRGVAWHNARSAMYARPYRWSIWFLGRYVLAVTFLFVTGHHQAAVWMSAGLPAGAGVLFLVLWLPDLLDKHKKEGK